MQAPPGLPPVEGVMFQVKGMGQMIHVRQHGVAEHLAVSRNAAYRHPAKIDAVIAPLPTDKFDPRTIASNPVPAQRDLQRGIDGLRA